MADAPSADEPEVADDHVRWWSGDRGWGVIAHHEGDVFVHFGIIEGTGYRSLHEDQHVAVTLGRGRQALFRQAAAVRPL